jgi:hypothetical protein
MTHSAFKSLIGFNFLLFTLILNAQDTEPVKYTSSNKGKFIISWGGNRDTYSRSDITFKGNDYNFTLKDVKSHDKPKGYHIDYINPTRMTIPQTNFKVGYFITDHYLVSIGVDHMKYVVTQNQFTNIQGTINLPQDQAGASFNGDYNNVPIQLTDDFLKFEHTDGLNYINTEISRVDDISSFFEIKNTDKIQINLTEGIGGGVLYPKTNTTLLGKERYDEFHVAGYGISARAGLNITFFKHFFIQADLKGGYINMNDIRTTKSSSDSASQEFFFLQRIISVGGIFRL